MKSKLIKNPSSAQVNKKVVELGSGTVGAMLARGTEALTITKNEMADDAIVAGGGVGTALFYNGPYKKVIKPLGFGMALYKGIKLATALVQKAVDTPVQGDGQATAFINKAAGLAGVPCGCQDHMSQQQALNAPAIEWIEEFNPDDNGSMGSSTYSPFRQAKNGIRV